MKKLSLLTIILCCWFTISCSDGDPGYCKSNSYDSAINLLSLTSFPLCGNLYRFNSHMVHVQIPTDSEIRESVGADYQPYFSNVFLTAIDIWNTELSGDIVMVPTFSESKFKVRFGDTPHEPDRYVAGLTTLAISYHQPSSYDLLISLDGNTPSDHIIDGVDIMISPRVPTRWSAHYDIDEQKLLSVTLHEFGHALGIWGHSSNPSDLMYPYPTVTYPSSTDTRTLRFVYSNKADIPIL